MKVFVIVLLLALSLAVSASHSHEGRKRVDRLVHGVQLCKAHHLHSTGDAPSSVSSLLKGQSSKYFLCVCALSLFIFILFFLLVCLDLFGWCLFIYFSIYLLLMHLFGASFLFHQPPLSHTNLQPQPQPRTLTLLVISAIM